MAKICYIPKEFQPKTLDMIRTANRIIAEYAAQGFDLTLRQLYYQMVSRDIILNKQSEYSRLGSIINDARLAGLVDWDAITDRTRNLRSLDHWKNPSDIVTVCAQQFRLNKWNGQENYVEVWIEKDALVGVIEGVCNELDLPHFSCPGYTSQSEMWSAAMRLVKKLNAGKDVVIPHMGDHDPSGIDMSRDIEDRLRLFCAKHTSKGSFELRRIALTRAQIDEFTPPPNPAKQTDSRFATYADEHGDESWELDALNPATLVGLIRDNVDELIDRAQWEKDVAEEDLAKEELAVVAENFDEAVCGAREA